MGVEWLRGCMGGGGDGWVTGSMGEGVGVCVGGGWVGGWMDRRMSGWVTGQMRGLSDR